jgi:phage-related tail fiber protein
MALLRNLVESAFVSLLNREQVQATVYAGISGTDKLCPLVKCQAKSAEEEPPFSGNYRVSVELVINVAATADATSFNALCEKVRDVIWTDELSFNLNQCATGLTVQAASAAHKVTWDTDEDVWQETHTVEIYCSLTP